MLLDNRGGEYIDLLREGGGKKRVMYREKRNRP